MKKHLIPTLFMLLGLAACQKESTNVKNTTATNLKPGLMTPAVNQLPDVVIMTQVGPDTYRGYFHASAIEITGPAYDRVKYPTVVDGIPVLVTGISTYDGASMIQSVNSGTEGNVFSTWVPILGGLVSPGFQSDYDNYVTDWSKWADGAVGPPPLLSGYLKPSYSSVGHSVVFTGKVIKVTTGSGVALTEIAYPLPTAIITPPSSITLTEFFNDPQYPNIRYVWKGKNGNIFSGVAIVNNTGSGTNIQITGGYTISADGATMHNWGTIIRTDGTSFPFDFSWAFE